MQERGQLVSEAHVARGSFAESLFVNPYFAVAVHAVEVDEKEPVFFGWIQPERFSVPAHAGREGAPRGPGRMFVAEGTFDAPVVREVQDPPFGVVVIAAGSQGIVDRMEFPAGIEIEPGSHRIWRAAA